MKTTCSPRSSGCVSSQIVPAGSGSAPHPAGSATPSGPLNAAAGAMASSPARVGRRSRVRTNAATGEAHDVEAAVGQVPAPRRHQTMLNPKTPSTTSTERRLTLTGSPRVHRPPTPRRPHPDTYEGVIVGFGSVSAAPGVGVAHRVWL